MCPARRKKSWLSANDTGGFAPFVTEPAGVLWSIARKDSNANVISGTMKIPRPGCLQEANLGIGHGHLHLRPPTPEGAFNLGTIYALSDVLESFQLKRQLWGNCFFW